MNPIPPASEEGHLLDHLAFVRERWLSIVCVFVGFVAISAVVTMQQPPVYRATTRVLVGTGLSSPLSERSSAIEGYLLERRSFDTQLEIMHSEPVAERAARRLGRIDDGTSPERREAAIATVKGAVTLLRVGDTRIVRLMAHDSRPEGARDLANAVAQAYIDYSAEQDDAARRESMEWLTRETANLRDELRASEERLVEYLSDEQIAPSDREGRGLASSSDPMEAEIASAEVELSRLQQRYRELHPLVVDARARLATLRRRAAEELSERTSENRKLIQYRLLKRNADLDQEMYQVLLKKLKEADLSSGLADSGVRVLEAAKLPHTPISPHVARNLGVATVLGLCLALGFAWAAESFDRSLRSPEEIGRRIGLPTLAVVGRFDAPDALRLPGAATAGSLAAETFRSLRTNVRFSHVDRPRRAVLVTSTGPEEGKSTVLSNLALSFAQSGRRTLLVDTDLRRPSLHRLFQVSNARGLADVLAGDAALSETVQPTAVEGLDVLPSGTLPANPAELIESTRLQQQLAELRERYEYVLLDSPPAGGLIDASLLSTLADGVLFVVEAGRYDEKSVRATLRQLERAGAKVYGVVLNKAQRDARTALYGYYASELEAKSASAAG